MTRIPFLASVILLCALYTLFVFPQFDQAVVGDECLMASAGESPTGVVSPSGMPVHDQLHHPHGFLLALWLAGCLFDGDIVTGARSFTLLCNLAVIVILCLVARRFSGGGCWPLMAGGVYAILPLATRAGALIQRDSSLFTLCLACVLMCLAHHRGRAWKYILPLVLFAALWTKLTASLQLAVCLVCLLPMAGKRLRWGLVAGLAGSGVFFLGSWFLYCRTIHWPIGGPFDYILSTVVSRMTGETNYMGGLYGVARLVLTMLAGFGPLGAIVWLVSIVSGGRAFWELLKAPCQSQEKPSEIDITIAFAFLFSASSIVGYSILGKEVFGFPVYHFPAVCTSALLVGWFLRRSEVLRVMMRSRVLGLFAVVSVPLVFLVQGDFAWTCLTLPRLVALGEMSGAVAMATHVLRPVVVAVCAMAFFWFLSRRAGIDPSWKWDRIVCAATLAFVVCSAGQNLRQALAPYSTLYGYGERDTQECAREVARWLQPGEEVLAPWYFIYNAYLCDGRTRTYPRYDWATGDGKRLMTELERPETRFFAASIWSLPISRRDKVLGDDEVQEIFRTDFLETRLGTWTIWEKRKLTAPGQSNL